MTARTLIRPPLPGDLRAIGQIERLSFSDPWPETFFATEIKATGRFQRVVVSVSGDLEAFLFAAWQHLDLHVLKVATRPDCRRGGHARRLMLLAHDHACELVGDSVTLEVRASNLTAQAMYLHLGYVVAGRRPRYYSDGEEALVMTYYLAAADRDASSA